MGYLRALAKMTDSQLNLEYGAEEQKRNEEKSRNRYLCMRIVGGVAQW